MRIVNWVGLAIIILFVPGCFEIYGSRHIKMKVEDIETGAAISGATIVREAIPGMFVLNSPDDKTFVTRSDGTASGWVPIYDRSWVVSADGYIEEPFYPDDLPDESSETLVFRLMKEPHPVFQIRMNPEYRGPIFIRYGERNNPVPMGQRVFVATVSGDGLAEFDMPEIYYNRHGVFKIYRNLQFISMADDQPIKPRAAESWENKNRLFLFIGSKEEYADWMKQNGFTESSVNTQWDHLKSVFEGEGKEQGGR